MNRSGRPRGRTRLPSEQEAAGRTLAAASVVPALALSGWLLAGLPLLLLGWFRPLPMALLGGATALLLCVCGLRRLPGTAAPPHRWATAATFAVALGSGVFNGLLHGEQLIVRRDPSTYAQYAVWLARHGSLPIPVGDFGGPDPALRFDSMGVYMTGDGIVPQFMAGPPMTYAIGHWLGGVPGLLLVPPVLGALAVLTVAGTAARLVGTRWAPLAALVFAISLPILYTSRTTFSEIPSLILLFGGMNLLLDARARLGAALPGAGFPSAALAGLSFGLALLVRIDGLRDVLPVLAFAGMLVALRRIPRERPFPEGRLGVPLLIGLVVGGAWGFTGGYVLARPYLEYLSGSLVPLLAICAVVVVLTAAGTALAPWIAVRARRLPKAGWLPNVAAALVVLVMAGFAVRPWAQTVRRYAVTPEDRLTADFIEKTQIANGLAKDSSRLYYEHSLDWVFWYVGIPAVVLATLAAAVLVRRLMRGGLTNAAEFGWLLPLAVIGWTTVTTLWRPAITPDHPFASRRLVPVVIPGLVLLAVWGLRRLTGWLSERLPERLARTRWFAAGPARSRVAVAAGALLLVVPPAITSIGTAFTPVNRGEAAAVAGLCRAIPANASVLIVERVTGDRLTQVVRGQCGLPAARVVFPQKSDVPLQADVLRLAEAVRRTGRVPVLLAAEPEQLMAYGPATRVMSLHTRQDERSLVDPPNGTWSLTINVWMTIPT
ncbi:hypothetical protein [Microbispora hainanensis]|uniref:hypothetical protein n=1 Tax=Microbispora hainanensis TaxID=568844 RepID=UPI001FCA8BB4|nr:hypothetical protein [Microbispora hainanensis]